MDTQRFMAGPPANEREKPGSPTILGVESCYV
jgi:hypothetical protein